MLTQAEILAALSKVDAVQMKVAKAFRGRLADSTNTSYDYSWRRLTELCGDASTRSTPIELLEFDAMSLVPTSTAQLAEPYPFDALESTLLTMITHEFTPDAPDGVDFGEWIEENPPPSPATLSMFLAGIKARASEFTRLTWEPSTAFTGSITGIRKALGRQYGARRQATPLMTEHIEAIALMLASASEPATITADRLIFEMMCAGIDTATIGRCQLAAFLPAGEYTTDDGTGQFGDRLVIDGRRRRGNKQDPATVVELSEHPLLAAALKQWLLVRPDVGEHILGMTGKNFSQRISDSLARTAFGADLDWTAADDTPSKSDTAAMRSVINAGSHLDRSAVKTRDHVALLTGFYGCMRRSELCALHINDIEFRNNANGPLAKITIRQSKTDQTAEGADVFVTNPPAGTAPAVMDILDHLGAYIEERKAQGATGESPLFPALNRDGTDTGNTMHAQQWSDRLRGYAVAARCFGDPTTSELLQRTYDRISGHSLRRGWVTSAVQAGVELLVIQKHGRWKNASTVSIYVDQIIAETFDSAAALYGFEEDAAAETPAAIAQRDLAMAEQAKLKARI